MAKIIRTSKECAYKCRTTCLYWAHNVLGERISIIPCKPQGEENFPKNCPLEDYHTVHPVHNLLQIKKPCK
jgi:hypothetical protein